MDFSIYPFKRYGKIRLYVRFLDPFDNEIIRSTSIAYEFDASEKERTEAKKKAEKRGKEIMQEYFKEYEEAYREPDRNPRLSNYLEDDYWPNIESNCKPRTVDRYKSNLDNFLRICKDRPMDAYRRIDIERYKQKRLKDGVKKVTVNIEIRGIKAAFNWAFKYNLIDCNPFKGQDFMFDVKTNKRAFTKKEIQKLLEATENTNIGLVIRLTYYTGMRLGEVSGLTWNYVHLEEKPFLHIPVELSKSGKPRQVPLVEKSLHIVKQLKHKLEEKKKKNPVVYENRSPEETYLLQKKRGWGMYCKRSIQDMFRKAMNKAGLPKELTFHCLRHSFATHILANNGDLYGVSKILGHSSTQVTQNFYDHTTGLNFRDTANLI